MLVRCILVLILVTVGTPSPNFSQKPHIEPKVGMSLSSDGFSQIWTSVGPDAYFIYELGTKLQSRDESVYYPSFDLSTVRPWNDRYISDISRYVIWGISSGYQLPKINLGLHLGVNIGLQNVRYVLYDETHTLSVNGLYSFPKENRGILIWRAGVLYEYRRHLVLRTDVNILGSYKGNVWLGLGYKF